MDTVFTGVADGLVWLCCGVGVHPVQNREVAPKAPAAKSPRMSARRFKREDFVVMEAVLLQTELIRV